uniref:Diamine acetyltransferase 2 n=1 Tax=Lygus hesperus TaxID=30085 RepID=A0A0A9W313_LYGHE
MSLNDIIVRPARREDCGEIIRLIKELAEFEKMPGKVETTAEILERDGFDTEQPAFLSYVAEDRTQPGEAIGYSICYISYDRFRGKAFFIEDIMISEKSRGKGIGKKLFQFLCKEALNLDCDTIRFYVLSWNPANAFYSKMGAVDLTEKDGWHWHILFKDQMEKAAKSLNVE